jgi:hypothetical protein
MATIPNSSDNLASQARGLAQQLTSEQAKPYWQWSDIDEKERTLAHGYLKTATLQIDHGELSVVPGIPATYRFDFEKSVCCFRPNDILLLPRLDRIARHEKFTEFLRLSKLMRDTDSWKEVYWDVWSLLVQSTERLRNEELNLYHMFAEQSNETEEQMQARNNDWMILTADQVKAAIINRATSAWSIVPETPKKRSRSEEGEAQHPSHPKKVRVERTNTQSTATPPEEQTPFPELIFETTARDQLLRHKKGEDTISRPKYNAQHAWAGTGACSKYTWRLSRRCKPRKRFCNPNDHGLRPVSDQENRKLPIWKRCYSADLVSLLRYPEQDPKNYSRRADGSFRCLHTD